METILKKLIKEKKEKEMIKLNAIEIVNALFSDLQERERDILSRRFALKEDKNQTLEEIGRLHNLTRERVRQIERASLKKIKKINDLDQHLGSIREAVSKLINEHGGMMERDFLLDILSVISFKIADKDLNIDKKVYKNYLDFLLSEVLDDYLEKVDKSNKFTTFFKLKDQAVDYLEDLADELKVKINEIKKTLHFEDLVNVLKNLKSFSSHKEKLSVDSDLKLEDIFRDETFAEWGDIIDRNKSFYSFMQAVKDINPNKFGHWGSDQWPEVKPKRITDKIYLVLKNEEKPLHFSEITEKINNVGFDHKKVGVGSVHNELILDDRYILTGRGVYGLKEWEK
jgi:hypothetical protein